MFQVIANQASRLRHPSPLELLEPEPSLRRPRDPFADANDQEEWKRLNNYLEDQEYLAALSRPALLQHFKMGDKQWTPPKAPE